MGRFDNIDFSSVYNSPEELAFNVLQVYFNYKTMVFPIDPFDIMRELKISYQLRNFSRLEGVYIVPEDVNDIPIVGININRPVTRQRFTAAHEICHHIKDKDTIACPIYGERNAIEIFADNFAAALLMPIEEIRKISDQYVVNGTIEFDSALSIAEYFSVSFQACIYRLAYNLHRISGNTTSKEIEKRIRKFKPEKKRIELGIIKQELPQLRNMINCYEFSLPNISPIVWHKFKIDFVYNENRLEGVDIELEKLAEIITDLRMNKQNSEFCQSEYQNIIEVAGHATLYDYIHSTQDKLSAFMILKLNQLMYQFTPHPELTGKFRNTSNLVIQSKFETSDYRNISTQISNLDRSVQYLLTNLNALTLSDYIEQSIKIHHRLTVIHPFPDGNGRVTRAFLNWLFRLRKLPPVYIKLENKQKYFDALSCADQTNDYDPLYEIFYHEIFRSMIELNSNFR
jgi:Zn-dependent peptidase ImmA (M78 family)/fido (protein-threonine AMPylation protein)